MVKDVTKYTNSSFASGHRYEMKYLISESEAAAIAQFIKPYVRLDYYSYIQPSSSYPIACLYLDSKDLQLCRQSMEGQKNRFKLRIRSYTDEQNYPCFFEIKRRMNTIIIKNRAPVLPDSMKSLFRGLFNPPQADDTQQQTLDQFLLYMAGINAKPVLRTRYRRQAFESILDKTVRVTFDRNLSFNITPRLDVGLNGSGWHDLPLNCVVLEIKFTGRYPVWLDRTVKYFNLRNQSVSKYVHSIKRASLLGLLFT